MPGEDKMKIRCKFALIVALLFFMTMMSNELPAFAEPELSLEQAIQNIQECDSKIDNNIDKLNKIKEEVSQKEKQIKDNEEQLKIAKEDVEEKDKKLADRLKGIQLNGGVQSTTLQYLDALISSGNVLEAMNKASLIYKICENDKNLILEAKESEKRIIEVKEEIEKEKADLQKNENDIRSQVIELEDQKDKLLKYIKQNNILLSSNTGITIPVTLSSDIAGQTRSLIEEAEKYLKVPYLWGGESPTGFDCSGLIQYVFKSQGIYVPRISQDQQSFAKKISISEIKPGDLVFNKPSESTHVGMYIGDDMYIQAPRTGDVVKISRLSRSNMKYVGRVLN